MTTRTDNKTRGELLKGLRETHSATFTRTQELFKAQKHSLQEISNAIQAQPSTVPAVATATGIPSHEVLWLLAAMKKYGLVIEDGMQGDYPLYRLVEESK